MKYYITMRKEEAKMRLIDADSLQAIFNEVSTSLLGKSELCKDTEHMVRAFIMTTEMIQDAQTIDAVPVVRCRDCKYSVNAKWNKKGYRICPASHMEITDNDFCSYGERKGQFTDPGKLEEEHNAAKETT